MGQPQIQIDTNWIEKELNLHLEEDIGDKITIRLYTVKSSLVNIDFISISNFLTRIIPQYALSAKQIQDDINRSLRRNESSIRKKNFSLQEDELLKIIEQEKERVIRESWTSVFNESRIFFRKKGEDYIGGKYGELLLFALVEGVLNCKMIAHKITHLTNVNDEVKGSDGVFIGNYKGEDALLIGESKIMQSLSNAITDSLDSINRYHKEIESAHNTSHEFLIARSDIHKYDDGTIDIDELFNRLDPRTDSYREQILVHPILLMYERAYIKKAIIKAKSSKELEDILVEELSKRIKKKKEVLDLVKSHVEDKGLEHAFLDFFLLPVDDVSKFRKAMDAKIQ